MAASLVMASTTCVTAVLPDIARDLRASQTELQWIADAYPVVLAALLLPSGAVLDRVGRRLGLVAGLVLLAGALVWSALAGTAESLILSRCLAGVGGALVFPATLATISAALHDAPGPRGAAAAAPRARAVALWAGAVMAGGGYGLVLGGAMAEADAWEGSFAIMAALAALTLVPALLLVPETRERDAPAVDWPGAALSLVAIGTATLAIIELPVHGIDDQVVALPALVALGTGLIFLSWQLRAPHPLIDVRLFANRAFSASAVAIFAMFGAAFGWFFLAFQFYAFVFGWSPLQSAVGLLPNIVPLVAFVPVGLALARRIGNRAVMVAGLLIMAAGAGATGLAGAEESELGVMAGFALLGAGGGLGQGPATQAIVDALPRAKQGVAGAVNDLSRELGAAVGIAVVGSAFTGAYRDYVTDAFGRDVPTAVLASPGAAQAAGAFERSVQLATVEGWKAGMTAAALMLLLGAAFVGLRGPRR